MVSVIQQATRRWLILLRLAAFVIAVVAVTLLLLLVALPLVQGGGPTAQHESIRNVPAELGGKGGSGEPPPELLAAFDSLPVYPGALSENGPNPRPESAEGRDVWEIYFVRAAADQVRAFYEQALTALGWNAQRAPTVQSGDKSGEQVTAVTTSFAKGNLQVTISVTSNTKDPERGGTQLTVAVTESPDPGAP